MQNQNQGGQSQTSQGQNQPMDWQSPNNGGRMQETQTPAGQNTENVRPEVENPQPVRKEEEPIVADSMKDAGREYNQDNDNRNVANTGTTTSNSDYRDSNVGFRQNDEGRDAMRNQSQKPSMASEDKEWRDQQMDSKS